MSSAAQQNKQGQTLGRKGQETRARLMDATRRLMLVNSPLELTAVGIAAEAAISPATFYMYFDDTKDILFALSEVAGEDMAKTHAIFDQPWTRENVEQQAAAVIEALNKVWDEHRAILRYRNLEATRGDARFAELRMNTFLPFIERFAERILSVNPAVPGGRKRADAYAEASILHGAMEHMAATDPEVMQAGLGAKRVNLNLARIVALTVCGGAAMAEAGAGAAKPAAKTAPVPKKTAMIVKAAKEAATAISPVKVPAKGADTAARSGAKPASTTGTQAASRTVAKTAVKTAVKTAAKAAAKPAAKPAAKARGSA